MCVKNLSPISLPTVCVYKASGQVDIFAVSVKAFLSLASLCLLAPTCALLSKTFSEDQLTDTLFIFRIKLMIALLLAHMGKTKNMVVLNYVFSLQL